MRVCFMNKVLTKIFSDKQELRDSYQPICIIRNTKGSFSDERKL